MYFVRVVVKVLMRFFAISLREMPSRLMMKPFYWV